LTKGAETKIFAAVQILINNLQMNVEKACATADWSCMVFHWQ